MRNLFFKVFALILFSAAALFASVAAFFHFIDDHNHFDSGYTAAYRLADEAVEVYETSGLGALKHQLNALHRRTGIRGFLMRGDGTAIGPPLPRFAREQITRFPQTVLQGNSPRGKRAIRAVSVSTEGNQNYRFVMVAGLHGGRAWIFGHPTTRLLLPLLVIALASLLISLLITRPLGGLKAATQNFASGNLAARAPRKLSARNDAFGELAREFDQMSARIQKLVGEHRRLLRDVSHELRSPLSRMQVAATLLEGNSRPAAAAEVARIQTEIVRLDALIAQLLSLTRLHAGSAALTLQTVNLGDLLQRVARDAAYEFSHQGKRVQVIGVDRKDRQTSVRADADKLGSAFENVIRNGLRYTRSALMVKLQRVSATPPMARIDIIDDGLGVPEKDLQNIFEAFFRPDQSRNEATGSAGIGLAIARGIIQVHGGTIQAANNPGGGLCVSIHLPVG